MKWLDNTALAIVIIGAVNWLLIGIFRFDLVAFLFGNMSWISRIVYTVVGLCGLYLISLFVNKEGDAYIRVKLDTENYRERRKVTLEKLAKKIAYTVKRTKKPVSLEPMNPYERRVIHSALQNDRYVCTRSEGEEPYRRVVIMLKKDR